LYDKSVFFILVQYTRIPTSDITSRNVFCIR